MIPIAIGLVGGILIALDAQRNLRTGLATTLFGTYARQDRPRAFWIVFGIKVLMSVVMALLASVLIVRSPQ